VAVDQWSGGDSGDCPPENTEIFLQKEIAPGNVVVRLERTETSRGLSVFMFIVFLL
jgi:hypothetical protein